MDGTLAQANNFFQVHSTHASLVQGGSYFASTKVIPGIKTLCYGHVYTYIIDRGDFVHS